MINWFDDYLVSFFFLPIWERSDNVNTLIKEIRYIWQIIFFQFYNMIKQQAIEKMGLKQIKRDFFDPGNVINKPEWQVAIWPGYKTTIRQHERELLLG